MILLTIVVISDCKNSVLRWYKYQPIERKCSDSTACGASALWGLWWIMGAVRRALSVKIVIFSSADPLHNGDGKRGYSDILGLLRDMIWKRLAAQKNGVFFVLCLCRKA